MKAYFFIILVLLVFFSFSWQNPFKIQKNIISLNAKVEKIDSTKSFYIVSIKSKFGKGIFFTAKQCTETLQDPTKIKRNQLYTFKLEKKIYQLLGHAPQKNTFEEIVDGKIIWNSNMKIVFYSDCLNMCGLLIDNKENYLFKKDK